MRRIFKVARRSRAPVNTVAPAISATAVIGTAQTGDNGTWTGSPSFTYQWQRNTGSWGDIGGATSKNYTPVDADFGYAIRLAVIPPAGSSTAYSNATNLVREAPAQSLGAELLANADFASWSSDNPTGWSVSGETGGSQQVTQTAPDGSAGTGAARFVSSVSGNPRIDQTSVTSGQWYEGVTILSAYTSGVAQSYIGGKFITLSAVQTQSMLVQAGSANVTVTTSGAVAHDFVIDSVSVKHITMNAQLTAPSANMRITQYYTLPGAPRAGSQIWIMPRVSDFLAGNYWLALLTYTGTQWDITLYSVAANTRTNRASATNIGSTNGLRINMNGSSIVMETTADGGSNWTQRGVTVTNSLYNASTGVNMTATSDFTLNNMVYEAAA